MAPSRYTDCQPTTNHSIPVSTYNSSVSVFPSRLSSLCFSTFLTLCSPSLSDFSPAAFFCYHSPLPYLFHFFSFLSVLPHLVDAISLHILTISNFTKVGSVSRKFVVLACVETVGQRLYWQKLGVSDLTGQRLVE
ncbi:hypothetical protein XENOCAPTIV_014132 [Xenoophorus captivus]|uniref:Uncharacterized protein n=1 Tax=Xenoophorus captivus TaxID=1517983 RepID=A0ABV0QDC0_9TELE